MKLNESSFLLGEELDFEKVYMISNDKISVSLSEHSRVKIETSNKRLIELLNKGEDIYYKPYVDGLVDDLYDLITRDGLEFIK